MSKMAEQVQAEFIENFLVVWDTARGSKLYRQGYYGKPIGIPKPKLMEFDVPLILDLMEGLYLAQKGELTVTEGAKKKRKITLAKLRQRARKLYDEFDLKYAVYRGSARSRINRNTWDKVRLRFCSVQTRTRHGTRAFHGLSQKTKR